MYSTYMDAIQYAVCIIGANYTKYNIFTYIWQGTPYIHVSHLPCPALGNSYTPPRLYTHTCACAHALSAYIMNAHVLDKAYICSGHVSP